MEFPKTAVRGLSRDVDSRTTLSGPRQSKSLLARRRRMKIRRFKMTMNDCPKFLNDKNKRPRSPSQPEEVTGRTSDAEGKLVILIKEEDGICGRVDVDIVSSAPVRVSGTVSESTLKPVPSVFRSGSLEVESSPVDSKANTVMGAVSINALTVIDKDNACSSLNCSYEGQRNSGILEAVCFCVKSPKPQLQNCSSYEDQQNIAVDRGEERPDDIHPTSMCEISSEDGNASVRNDSCPPHGLVSLIGRRREMEDTAVAIPSFVCLPSSTVGDSSSKKAAALHFFGVYDGHGGSQAAVFCKDRLHAALAENLKELIKISCGQHESVCGGIPWQQTMASCFLQVDAEIGGLCLRGAGCQRLNGNPDCCREPSAPETVGTTAVVAVLSPSQIVVANCGDSRAVMIKSGKAIAMSQDHKPDRQDELERIEAAGGRVIYWNGNRVLGVLAMSRAIGDRYLKPYVIPDPDVVCMERSQDDECLILASDGLWEVLSEEDVCEVVRKCLRGKKRHQEMMNSKGQESAASAAAALLTKLALARGSTDNISVVVVDLIQKNSSR